VLQESDSNNGATFWTNLHSAPASVADLEGPECPDKLLPKIAKTQICTVSMLTDNFSPNVARMSYFASYLQKSLAFGGSASDLRASGGWGLRSQTPIVTNLYILF